MRSPELLPQRFDLELPSEKILRVRFGERSKTRVRPFLLEAWKLQMDFFESSRERGQPATLPLNQFIPGWTEGVMLMKVGSVHKLFIPGELAYGMQVRPDSPFGPMATLIFEVELLSINGQS